MQKFIIPLRFFTRKTVTFFFKNEKLPLLYYISNFLIKNHLNSSKIKYKFKVIFYYIYTY